MTRRSLAVAVALVLLAGAAGAAVAQAPGPTPSAADVKRYCSVEEQGVRTLAAELQRRSRQLDAREQSIAARGSELAAAETRLRTRLKEIEEARARAAEAEGRVTAAMAAAEARRTAKVTGLVQMVEASKPERVAPMFREIDGTLAVEVLDGMQRTKAGKLLAALPPSHAAALAERMAKPIVVGTP